jgi:hypothetical protein
MSFTATLRRVATVAAIFIYTSKRIVVGNPNISHGIPVMAGQSCQSRGFLWPSSWKRWQGI